MEDKKEEQKKKEAKKPVSTNKNRTIPKADVEMMREDRYEEYMNHYKDH